MITHFIHHFMKGFMSLILLCSSHAFATIKIDESKINASIPSLANTAAYMTIINNGKKNATLLRITSEISDKIELHQHTMVNGMMKMSAVANVVIESEDKVVFQPYGYHVMLIDVKRALIEGDNIALTLHFDNQIKITSTFKVQGLKHTAAMHHH